MRPFQYALLATLALTIPAAAADLPHASEPVAPTPEIAMPYSWTGFYVGAQGGYQWSKASGPLSGMPYKNHPNGGFVGGHAGYNYQYDSFVVGLEGDANAALGASGSNLVPSALPVQGPYRIRTKQDWNADIRARFGYAIDRFLPYIAGGIAFGDAKSSYLPTGPNLIGAQNNTNRTGWTIGAGLEYAITDNITARIEYRYTDFGKKKYSDPEFGYHDNVAYTTNSVLVGVSYKF